MNWRLLYRILPLVTAALVGVVIALAVSGGSTRSVTTTTVIPQVAHPAQPATFSSPKGHTIHQLYTMDDPGVVDITTQSVQNTGGLFNFGQQQVSGEGAGVVYDKKGDIITDQHVVAGANKVTVHFPSGQSAAATIVGSDAGADVAVIHVNVPSSWLHPLQFADSNDVQVGDSVIAIGSPFGLPNTVTAGIVSATGRTITAPNQFTIANAIQTDAPINPGNSGGPLINAAGQVIGLNDQIETNTQNSSGQGQSSGVGFATPSNADVRIANQIIKTGKAQNAYVGISLQPPSSGTGAEIAPSTQSGLPSVVPGGPAAKAGLRPGDVITAVNGRQITSVNQFIGTIAQYSPGDTVTLTVQRGGQTRHIKLTLGSQPANAPSANNQGGGGFNIPIP